MMSFQIVVLWSDILVWLLLAAGIGFAVLVAHNPPLLAAWRRVGANRVGMASATLLAGFALVGLLDSVHYRVALDGKPGQKTQYGLPRKSPLASSVSRPPAMRMKRGATARITSSAGVRGFKVAQKSGSVKTAFGRIKDFIVGNF